MKVENPVALQYLLQDEIFLLNNEKYLFVEEAEIIAAEKEIIEIQFNHLGKNQQQLLILVHYPDLEHINETHLSALENILKRKELRLDDVAIVNLHRHEQAALTQLVAHFSPVKLLVLGERAIPSGLMTPQLNQSAEQNGIQMLYSFSFDEMMDSNDKKKLFWEQMKTL